MACKCQDCRRRKFLFPSNNMNMDYVSRNFHILKGNKLDTSVLIMIFPGFPFFLMIYKTIDFHFIICSKMT